MKRYSFAAFRCRLAILFLFWGIAARAQLVGPAEGTLIIAGGGRLPDTVLHAFIQAAGGMDAPIVVIPTAGGAATYTEDEGQLLRKLGARNVTVSHTYDRAVANTEDFYRPIRKARGIWFSGGRQWRLVDAYAGTGAEDAFHEVLRNGGVIGGTSAGATIQGDYLVRGDTRNNTILMGDHEKGFAFLKNVAIDQHVLVRNRPFDLFEVLEAHPGYLGIGLDEGTAIRVQKDTFDVIGRSYVLMYDGALWSREGNETTKLPLGSRAFYFLKEGDRYSLSTRQVLLSRP
jgi:cyanophycinase